jgi:hypothetical protein
MNTIDALNTAIPILTLILILFLLYIFGSKNRSVSDFFFESKYIDGWEISIVDIKLHHSLTGTSFFKQTSDAADMKRTCIQALKGKTLLFVKIIADQEEGSSIIDWKNICVRDSSGHNYVRMNDSFLDELGLKRISSKPLSTGINRGWIAFDLDKNARRLKLGVTSGEESIDFKLRVQ